MAAWISFGLFALAGVIHLGFFIFEVFVVPKPAVKKVLNITDEQHQAIIPWGKNQSAYNLVLALGVVVGLYFVLSQKIMLAGTLIGFIGVQMIAAGIAFGVSFPKFWKWAFVQAGPPLVGFVFLASHIMDSIR